jgi:hypothetical protein
MIVTQQIRNQAFYALCALLQDSAHAKSRADAAARGIVRHEILPIIRAGFQTYPELETEEILELCTPALVETLRQIMER